MKLIEGNFSQIFPHFFNFHTIERAFEGCSDFNAKNKFMKAC